MSFQTDIEAITGSIGSITTEATEYLREGVKQVTKFVMKNPEMKMRLTQDTSLTNASPQLVMTNVLHIASVTRLDADSGGQARSCTEIPEELVGQYEDVNSIYYTTKLDPKYYVANNILSVLPEPTANQTAKVKHITPETNTALSENDIDNFPPELNRGVILYAAGEVLRKFLSLKNATLVGLSMQDVVPPSSPSLDSIIYNGPGNADVGGGATASTVSNATNVSASSKISLGAAPSYDKLQNYTLSTIGNISALDLTGISIPSSNIGLSIVTYSGPSNSDVGTISTTSVGFSTAITSGDKADVAPTPVYNTPTNSVDFTTANIGVDAYLGTEDVELASAALRKEQQKLQDYQADIQNNSVEFNSSVEKFRADNQMSLDKVQRDLQASIQTAQLDLAEAQADAQIASTKKDREFAEKSQRLIQNAINDMSAAIKDNEFKIAEFNALINKYQAEVNTTISEHQSNIAREIQKAQLLRSTELSQFGVQMQDELNNFQSDAVSYQSNIQAELDKTQRDLQALIVEAQNDLSAAQATAQLATNVALQNQAEKSQRLIQNAIKDMETAIQNNAAKISKYNSEIQSYATQVTEEVQKYQSELQEVVQDYNWIAQQYQITKNDFIDFLSPYLLTRGVPSEVAANDRPS